MSQQLGFKPIIIFLQFFWTIMAWSNIVIFSKHDPWSHKPEKNFTAILSVLVWRSENTRRIDTISMIYPGPTMPRSKAAGEGKIVSAGWVKGWQSMVPGPIARKNGVLPLCSSTNTCQVSAMLYCIESHLCKLSLSSSSKWSFLKPAPHSLPLPRQNS